METTNGPSSKRPKLANRDHSDSVSSKVRGHQYTALDELVTDVDQASSNVLSSLSSEESSPDGGTQWRYAPVSLELGQLSAQVRAFKKLLGDIARREIAFSGASTADGHSRPKTEGNASIMKSEGSQRADSAPERKTVLTLYGNAQGHKQLFSSLQKPSPNVNMGQGAVKNAIIPLRENGLPPQIFSTKVISTEADDLSTAQKHSAQFRDVFAPSSELATLNPPKASCHSNSKAPNITWMNDASVHDSVRELDYTTHKLATGQWLGYDGVSPAKEPSSPEAKRKLRDRALSIGEASLVPSEGAKAAEAQAKEEALFRSTYSSFAPCKDDSAAIVPEQVKNQIWWENVGQYRFEQIFEIDPRLNGLDEPTGSTFSESQLEEEGSTFDEVVKYLDPSLDPLREGPAESAIQEDKTAKALDEISELLEIIHSSQRLRKSSASTGSRSGVAQTNAPRTGSGTPLIPTASEIQSYEKAKLRLAELVGHLPPHSLAKLNGDQLSALLVSRSLWVDGKDYKGVLEEDQMSRVARAAALSAALGPAAPSRALGTPAARPSQMSQTGRSNASLSQYPSASNIAQRPSSSYQHQPLSHWQTPAQQLASMQRPPYAQQNSYNRTAGVPPPSFYLNKRPSSSQQWNISTGNEQAPSQPQYHQRTQSWTGSSYQRSIGVGQPAQQGSPPLYNAVGAATGGSTARQPPRAPFPAQASQYVPPSVKPGSPALPNNARPLTPIASQPAQAQGLQAQNSANLRPSTASTLGMNGSVLR